MKSIREWSILPDWKNVLASLASAVLLIGAFPGFEYWFLAWFALVPLLWAIEREKESAVKSFVLGWIFGTVFFFGTCWWLTFAPITYAGFPWPLAYFLMLGVTAVAGIFPGIFAAVLSILLKRFGYIALLASPFIWVFTEFLRYWLTGNNWNGIGYSQAFSGRGLTLAAFGGIWMTGWFVFLPMCIWTSIIVGWQSLKQNEDFRFAFDFHMKSLIGKLNMFDRETWKNERDAWMRPVDKMVGVYFVVIVLLVLATLWFLVYLIPSTSNGSDRRQPEFTSKVVAVQPNVPMSGLTPEKWKQLQKRHVELAESALQKLTTGNRHPTTVIFPESPMNFMYEEDPETRTFINSFATKNNVSVLFNSAEPDSRNGKFFNSAVMVGPEGKETAQYDKIYLVPFGESVPAPLQSIVPAFVGSFSYGSEYDLFPLGDAKAGVMICFESHFGQLSREYVRNGADVIIEMTNDGYLGPTPILRQHLANAVFRAVETNRPVLRVTNVGITAYINERGEVLDPAASYTEDTRVWSVSKSDGKQTFYVRYGDWFAWLCSAITIGLLIFSLRSRQSPTATRTRKET